MPSIDSNDVFAELNCSFEEQFNHEAQPYLNNGATIIPSFSIWYNSPQSDAMDTIIDSWSQKISELLEYHYAVDWNYDCACYMVTFNSAVAMPRRFECLIASDMGFVDA
jgi:hypothetical protein